VGSAPVIHAHATALWDLAASGAGAPTVYRGGVPTTAAAPYALIYISDVDPENGPSRTINGDVGSYCCWAYVHCVGATQEAALRVADLVRDRLLNVAPTIAGRQCRRIRREDGRPVERDQSTTVGRWDKVDVYRLDSEPA
jgi:hypothetical protein